MDKPYVPVPPNPVPDIEQYEIIVEPVCEEDGSWSMMIQVKEGERIVDIEQLPQTASLRELLELLRRLEKERADRPITQPCPPPPQSPCEE